MKRIFIEIKILNSVGLKLPCDVKYKMSALIYNILNDDELHNSKEIKNFTFSDMFFDNYDFFKGVIRLKSNKGAFIFSSNDENIVNNFVNNISTDLNRIYKLGNMFFNISSFKEDNFISDDNIFLCETITPICLTKPGDRYEQYLNPKDPEYDKYMMNHLKKRLEGDPNISFQIHNDTVKSKMYDIKGIKTRGFKYRFMIKVSNSDDSKTLFNELYYSGLGSKCSQGFGLIKVLESQK